MDTTKLADLAAVLTGGITAGSVVVAAVTYLRAEGRKRKEFAATEYRRFGDAPAVKNVMVLLDGEWGAPTLILGGKDVAKLDYKEVVAALRIHEPTMQFEPWEWEVRAAFDEFLDGLVTFAQFLRCGLLKRQDIRPYLEYWLKIICGRSWMDQPSTEMLWAYIDFYGYADVRWLTVRMGYSPPRERCPRPFAQSESGEIVNTTTQASATSTRGDGSKP